VVLEKKNLDSGSFIRDTEQVCLLVSKLEKKKFPVTRRDGIFACLVTEIDHSHAFFYNVSKNGSRLTSQERSGSHCWDVKVKPNTRSVFNCTVVGSAGGRTFVFVLFFAVSTRIKSHPSCVFKNIYCRK